MDLWAVCRLGVFLAYWPTLAFLLPPSPAVFLGGVHVSRRHLHNGFTGNTITDCTDALMAPLEVSTDMAQAHLRIVTGLTLS